MHIFGGVVPDAELHGCLVEGIGFKSCKFFGTHVAALEVKAFLGGLGESLVVGFVDGAKVAFGGYVETDGLDDFIGEDIPKKGGGNVFVVVVFEGGVVFFVGVIGEDVADVVKQGGCDVFGILTGIFGQVGSLQAMLHLGDVFFVVFVAVAGEVIK